MKVFVILLIFWGVADCQAQTLVLDADSAVMVELRVDTLNYRTVVSQFLSELNERGYQRNADEFPFAMIKGANLMADIEEIARSPDAPQPTRLTSTFYLFFLWQHKGLLMAVAEPFPDTLSGYPGGRGIRGPVYPLTWLMAEAQDSSISHLFQIMRPYRRKPTSWDLSPEFLDHFKVPKEPYFSLQLAFQSKYRGYRNHYTLRFDRPWRPRINRERRYPDVYFWGEAWGDCMDWDVDQAPIARKWTMRFALRVRDRRGGEATYHLLRLRRYNLQRRWLAGPRWATLARLFDGTTYCDYGVGPARLRNYNNLRQDILALAANRRLMPLWRRRSLRRIHQLPAETVMYQTTNFNVPFEVPQPPPLAYPWLRRQMPLRFVNVPYQFFAPDGAGIHIEAVNGIPWNEYRQRLRFERHRVEP